MALKFVGGNTSVVYTVSKHGQLEIVDIERMIENAVPRTIGYGDTAEQFKAWLKTRDDNELREVKVFRHDTEGAFPDGIVLENCHVHAIRETFGGWSVDISWENERPYVPEEWENAD